MMQEYEGTHDGPMKYNVHLAPPDHAEAWLAIRFSDGDPEMRLLCRPAVGHELNDCAAALWRDGAHYDSRLWLLWGMDADKAGDTPVGCR
jgi:hypothetical protein